MNLDLEIEFSKAPILQEIDALKKQIDDMRPLPPDVEGRVMQKLRLDWNYNSNAIEGNKLSYGETTALLMHGITAKGKPLKDHLDIKGHNKAVEYLETIIKDERDFTQMDIRGLHEVILGETYDVTAQTLEGTATHKQIEAGKYKSMPNHVRTVTGEVHYYATPEETPAQMDVLMAWYNEANISNIHPVISAALFHHRFVEIHPFDDGNGRMARILMNLILMKNGYPPAVVKKVGKDNYYALLSQADSGSDWPFIEYIAELTQNSLQLYLKAINGGDINEDEDIDKEIALFKMELNNDVNLQFKKSFPVIEKVIKEDIALLIKKSLTKLKEFDDLFFENQKFVRFRYIINTNSPTSSRQTIKNDDVETIVIPVKDINTLECHFVYKDFKKAKNMFGIDVEFKVFFEEYSYTISNFNGKITKYYHEYLTTEEQTLVVKDIVSNVISQIKTQLEKG